VEIELDKPKCIAAGNCVMLSPEVFDQDDEGGIVFLVNENPGDALHQSVRDAAAACPARAIRLSS
jgi:ferredoxin